MGWRSGAGEDGKDRHAARCGGARRGWALPLTTAVAELPSKFGWLTDGWVVLRSVRDQKVVDNVARLRPALDDDSFEVMFNNFSLEQLLAAGKQRPTHTSTGGRFMRKFGGRAPAPLADLPSHDFEEWIAMRRVAQDMLYIVSLGLGQGEPKTKPGAEPANERGAAGDGEHAEGAARAADDGVGAAGGAEGGAGEVRTLSSRAHVGASARGGPGAGRGAVGRTGGGAGGRGTGGGHHGRGPMLSDGAPRAGRAGGCVAWCAALATVA
eukprot:TRINITY_DN5361_c0_g1_i1.p1 TRINITY_DN5361_c0_g1~~TRINITY_DN5361_c0_g1_i1.p1  ORF type:complete len:267 (+),score=29.20 TRINITY_DN5361_c0_g1_i1:425-1225(+)